jgi:hypothetical protein
MSVFKERCSKNTQSMKCMCSLLKLGRGKHILCNLKQKDDGKTIQQTYFAGQALHRIWLQVHSKRIKPSVFHT